MTELETMERAKMYIEKMANGIDPLSGRPVQEGDLINNVRISRCLFYVADILQKVIDNQRRIGRAGKRCPSNCAKKKKQSLNFRRSQFP